MTKFLDKIIANRIDTNKDFEDLFVFVQEEGKKGSYKINEKALGLVGKISPNAVVANALMQISGVKDNLNETTCSEVRDYMCANLNLNKDSLNSFSMPTFEKGKDIEFVCNGNVFNFGIGNEKAVIISVENQDLYNGTQASTIEKNRIGLIEKTENTSTQMKYENQVEQYRDKKLESFKSLTNSVSCGENKNVGGFFIAQQHDDESTSIYEGHLTLSQPEEGSYVFASSKPESYTVNQEGETIQQQNDEFFPTETKFNGQPSSQICDLITKQSADFENAVIALYNKHETAVEQQDDTLGQ